MSEFTCITTSVNFLWLYLLCSIIFISNTSLGLEWKWCCLPRYCSNFDCFPIKITVSFFSLFYTAKYWLGLLHKAQEKPRWNNLLGYVWWFLDFLSVLHPFPKLSALRQNVLSSSGHCGMGISLPSSLNVCAWVSPPIPSETLISTNYSYEHVCACECVCVCVCVCSCLCTHVKCSVCCCLYAHVKFSVCWCLYAHVKCSACYLCAHLKCSACYYIWYVHV